MTDALPDLLQGVVHELLARFERLETLEAEVAKLREETRTFAQLIGELKSGLTRRSAPIIPMEKPVPATYIPAPPPVTAVVPQEGAPSSLEAATESVSTASRTVTTPVGREVRPAAGVSPYDSNYDRDADTKYLDDAPRRPFVKSLPATDDELPLIEQRCRLKAEACRWAEERRRRAQQSADFRSDVEPKDRDLIAHAKQIPDCFLWMSHPSAPNPPDANDWLILAGCFDALANGVGLMQRLLEEAEEGTEIFQQGVDLLAEAQSAVRIAVLRMDGPPTDHDQARVFGWLKMQASNRQLFIRRFMRLDDPAEPARWGDLNKRVMELAGRWDESRKKVTNRKKIFGRLRYKLSQVGTAGSEAQGLWMTIADDVDELVKSGLPPSNLELRDLLADHVEQLPELATMPAGFQLTIREIDKYLATAPTREERDVEDAADPLFSEVAEMLAGKAVILIGGERRPHAAESIEHAFLLSELIWIDTRAHESTAGFEPYVARPEVAMVLLAIRWSSHSYGEVQDFCRQYGKPLVRLPGGYNPRQIAAQILDQCSNRLTTNDSAVAK